MYFGCCEALSFQIAAQHPKRSRQFRDSIEIQNKKYFDHHFVQLVISKVCHRRKTSGSQSSQLSIFKQIK